MIGFILKKTISQCFVPFNISLVCLTLGRLMSRLHLSNKGNILILFGIICLYFFSTPWTANHLLTPLESRYPNSTLKNDPNITKVVVLGGGLPQTLLEKKPFKLSTASHERLIQGITVYQALRHNNQKATLILSGGNPYHPKEPEAKQLKEEAMILGIPEKDILIESTSKDTAEEAHNLLPVLNTQPFYLVTSASHLPRAMKLFQNAGMNPIATPCNYLTNRVRWWTNWLPRSNQLGKSQAALHEYLGMLWAKLNRLL